MAYGKSQIFQAAAGANVTPETALMSPEQARQAEADFAVAAAFALLDAIQLRTAAKFSLQHTSRIAMSKPVEFAIPNGRSFARHF